MRQQHLILWYLNGQNHVRPPVCLHEVHYPKSNTRVILNRRESALLDIVDLIINSEGDY